MMRRATMFILGAVAVASIAGAAFGQSAKTHLTDEQQAIRFNDISDRLVCQCGCQMILRVCNHQNCPSAIPMRREIERQIVEGKTNDEIVQSFVDKEGLKVLSSPPAEGLNLAAWVMPGFFVLVGIFFIAYMAAQWMARKRLATAGARIEIDPDVRARMEREIKEMKQ